MNTSNTSNKPEGLWIPMDILSDSELTLQEKVILSMIKALDKGQGCFASNEYFANLVQLKIRRVSEIIGSLKTKGYIESEVVRGTSRTIKVIQKNATEEPAEDEVVQDDSKVIPLESKKKKEVMYDGVDLTTFPKDALERMARRIPELGKIALENGLIDPVEEVESEWFGVNQLKFL